MAITEKSSLDELLENLEHDDPVQKHLADARELLDDAKEKLGIGDAATEARASNSRHPGTDA